ncbi:MAG: enoyl-CoA hydratase-related protein, partial [Bryobacteraceae bacterium]
AGRGFCAGADMSLLSGIAAHGIGEREKVLANTDNGVKRESIRPDFQKKYSYFPSLQKPVIAAINGPAVGLGFIITLYCDLRFASDAARFGTAFAKRGLIAEYGLAWLLPRLIGPANALDLLFSARLIDAGEALRMGLVNQVFPQGAFLDHVLAYAKELAHSVSPRSMRVIKQQVYNAMFQSLSEAFDASEQEMIDSLQCEDFKEGVAHFVEKRAAHFSGR